jgi:hypothetical protein
VEWQKIKVLPKATGCKAGYIWDVQTRVMMIMAEKFKELFLGPNLAQVFRSLWRLKRNTRKQSHKLKLNRSLQKLLLVGMRLLKG